MIRIAARIGREWLERPGDLAFLSSIGVEFVDVEFGVFPGFDEGRGAPDRSSIGSVVDLLGGHGLRLERANYPKTEIMPYYLGQPEAGRVIDNLCRAAELWRRIRDSGDGRPKLRCHGEARPASSASILGLRDEGDTAIFTSM